MNILNNIKYSNNYNSYGINGRNKMRDMNEKNNEKYKLVYEILNLIQEEIIDIKSKYDICKKHDIIERKYDIHHFYENIKSKLLFDTDNEYNIFHVKPKKYILEHMDIVFEYKFTICERNISLFFLINSHSDKGEIYNIRNKYIMDIFILLTFIIPYSDRGCSNELIITIILSDLEKKIDFMNTRYQGKLLIPKNVNGGVSYTCNPKGEIVIFRKEEWFKVLIHELFHILGLDFSKFYNDHREKLISTEMNKMFHINSRFLIFETYAEFWACIIHSIFVNCRENIICNNSNNIHNSDKQLSIQSLKNIINTEIKYSLFQMIKILSYMGLKYSDIINNHDSENNKFNEETNGFCYYILKCVLLTNYEDFILWCLTNNDDMLNFTNTDKNIMLFIGFINNNYNSRIFLKNIDYNTHYINSLENIKYHENYDNKRINNIANIEIEKRELFNSMKMTFYG